MEEQLVLGSSVVEQFRDPVLLQVEFLVYDLLYFVEQQMIVERHLLIQIIFLFKKVKFLRRPPYNLELIRKGVICMLNYFLD